MLVKVRDNQFGTLYMALKYLNGSSENECIAFTHTHELHPFEEQ